MWNWTQLHLEKPVQEPPSGPVLDRGWAWAILTSCCLAQILMGTSYTLGMFNLIFLDVFGKDRQTTAWPSAVQASMLSLTAPVSSVIYQRAGLRWTTIIGGLIGSVGFFLTYFATSFVHLFITFGVLVGLWNGIAYLPCVLAVGVYFKKYRNIAYGLTFAAVGISTMVMPTIIEFAAEYYGWRGCMLIMCGIQLQLVLCGAILRPQDILLDASEVISDPEAELESCDIQGGNPSPKNRPMKSKQSQNNISAGLGDSYVKLHLSLQELDTSRKQRPLLHEVLSKSHHNLRSENPNYSRSAHYLSPGLNLYSCTPSKEIKPHNDKYNGVICSDPGLFHEKTEETGNYIDDSSPTGRPASMCATLKNKNALILFMNTLLVSAAVLLAYIHFPAYILQQGAAPSEVNLLFNLIGISNIICRILMGAAINSGEISSLIVYLASGGVSSIFILLLPELSKTLAGRVVFAIGFGFYGNVFNVLLVPVTLELFTLEQLAVVHSVNLVGCGVGGLVGPPMGGWIYDMSGGYTTFVVAGVLHLIGSLCMLLVPSRKHPTVNDSKVNGNVKVINHDEDIGGEMLNKRNTDIKVINIQKGSRISEITSSLSI